MARIPGKTYNTTEFEAAYKSGDVVDFKVFKGKLITGGSHGVIIDVLPGGANVIMMDLGHYLARNKGVLNTMYVQKHAVLGKSEKTVPEEHAKGVDEALTARRLMLEAREAKRQAALRRKEEKAKAKDEAAKAAEQPVPAEQASPTEQPAAETKPKGKGKGGRGKKGSSTEAAAEVVANVEAVPQEEMATA